MLAEHLAIRLRRVAAPRPCGDVIRLHFAEGVDTTCVGFVSACAVRAVRDASCICLFCLPPAYFQHLGTIVLLLWLLPSWLVRSMIARSGPKAKEALKKDLVSSKVNASMLPVLQDVEAIISLRKQVAG